MLLFGVVRCFWVEMECADAADAGAAVDMLIPWRPLWRKVCELNHHHHHRRSWS